MSSRNGLGPNNLGPLTGRGMGNCATGNNIGKIGLGIGAGIGMAWGCRNGFAKRRSMNFRGMGRGIGIRGFQQGRGFTQKNSLTEEESLIEYSNQLKKELVEVEKQLANKTDD